MSEISFHRPPSNDQLRHPSKKGCATVHRNRQQTDQPYKSSQKGITKTYPLWEESTLHLRGFINMDVHPSRMTPECDKAVLSKPHVCRTFDLKQKLTNYPVDPWRADQSESATSGDSAELALRLTPTMPRRSAIPASPTHARNCCAGSTGSARATPMAQKPLSRELHQDAGAMRLAAADAKTSIEL
jgi:hypothetical protein